MASLPADARARHVTCGEEEEVCSLLSDTEYGVADDGPSRIDYGVLGMDYLFIFIKIGEEEGGDGTAENATLHTEYHDRKSVRMDEIRMIGCYRLLASLPAKTGG
ncbi:hypothetical protein H103_05355, partial [Trichophyton rubrum CBS 288.86]